MQAGLRARLVATSDGAARGTLDELLRCVDGRGARLKEALEACTAASVHRENFALLDSMEDRAAAKQLRGWRDEEIADELAALISGRRGAPS